MMEKNRRILLVDDDEDDVMLLKEALEGLNIQLEIEECRDGRSALNYLREKQIENSLPSLVVLDINMPILDGREVLAILKSDPVLKKIPAVVFTTSSNPADIKYCEQFNVTMLTKPFNLSELHDIAAKMISYCNTQLAGM